MKLTDSGRPVYGGGGITPDEKIAEIKDNHTEDSLLQHYAFFNFTKHYLANHNVSKDMVVDDAMLNDFKAFLREQKIDLSDKDLNDNLDWIKMSIKSELLTSQFGQTEGMHVRAQWDPQIQKALTYMPEALALEEHKLPSQTKSTQTASVQK